MNIYAPNVGAAKYINQLITKVKTYLDNSTLILGDFNTALSANDRYSTHNITKETRALNETLDQMDFTDTGSQIRSQLIPKDRDCHLYIFRPQYFET